MGLQFTAFNSDAEPGPVTSKRGVPFVASSVPRGRKGLSNQGFENSSERFGLRDYGSLYVNLPGI